MRTFQVKSGYWTTTFSQGGLTFPTVEPQHAYEPGSTQYLHMYPAGHGTFSGQWVSKSEAEKGIAEIRKISQML